MKANELMPSNTSHSLLMKSQVIEKANPDIDAFEMEFLQMIGQGDFQGELYDEATADLETI